MPTPISSLKPVIDQIRELLSAEKTYLFSVKRDEVNGEITEFSLGVITPRVDGTNRNAVIKEVYLAVDSEISYNLFLYSPDEWERLTEDSSSFASRILRKGTRIE